MQTHVCVRLTVHVCHGGENRLLSLCVSACRRCVRGDRATAREVRVCWYAQSSRLHFHTCMCAREGEQAADKRASTSVCRSGCTWGFAGQGRTSACKHQTPSQVAALEARRRSGCPGCAARGERRQHGAGEQAGVAGAGRAWVGWEGNRAARGLSPRGCWSHVLSVPSLVQEALLDRRRQHQRGQHGRQQPHSSLHQSERACWYGSPLSPWYYPAFWCPCWP